MRGVATCAIDVSDGLLQDLGHLCRASDVGAEIVTAQVPVCKGAELAHALTGGDDYELLSTATGQLPVLDVAVHCIGEIVAGSGLRLDGHAVDSAGYRHFS